MLGNVVLLHRPILIVLPASTSRLTANFFAVQSSCSPPEKHGKLSANQQVSARFLANQNTTTFMTHLASAQAQTTDS